MSGPASGPGGKLRVTFGIDARPSGGGFVSGHFVNDVGATPEECADWIVTRTRRQMSDASRAGWQVCIWIGGRVAYEHTYGQPSA